MPPHTMQCKRPTAVARGRPPFPPTPTPPSAAGSTLQGVRGSASEAVEGAPRSTPAVVRRPASPHLRYLDACCYWTRDHIWPRGLSHPWTPSPSHGPLTPTALRSRDGAEPSVPLYLRTLCSLWVAGRPLAWCLPAPDIVRELDGASKDKGSSESVW